MDDNVHINFISRSILHTHQFSWVFLVDWLMVLALSVFALFYINQLLGFVFTNTVGWYLWHRYGVYLKVQSIQISLLGGRILFRNIVYIGTSQAVRVVHGTLSWRYWIQRRRRAAFLSHPEDGDNDDSTSNGPLGKADGPLNGPLDDTTQQTVGEGAPRPTRSSREWSFNPMGSSDLALNLKVHGVEWFVYNREYAYDSLARREPATAELAREFEKWQSGLSFMERKFMELLPLHLDVRTLGAVMGNDDTESLVVLSSQKVDCIVDMAPASTAADRYMSVIDARFIKLKVEFRDNIDYQVSSITPERQSRNFSRKKERHEWMRRLLWRTKKEPNKPWFGLKRYIEGDEDDFDAEKFPQDATNMDTSRHESKSKMFASKNSTSYPEDSVDRNGDPDSNDPVDDEKPMPTTEEVLSQIAAMPTEYARVSQLLACDSMDFQFRVDVVGPAQPQSDSQSESDEVSEEEKYGIAPPIFDTNMVFYGAKINYGPYAERQRQAFFEIFFPRNCNPDPMPTIGSFNGLRVHTHASVSIILQGETTLMVPVREKSKDETFASNFVRNMQTFGGEVQRSYGWLEVRATEGSKADIVIPFLPRRDADNSADTVGGFSTECDLSLIQPTIRTSVNHDTFVTAKSYHMRAVQYQPNKFNSQVTYDIKQTSSDLDCFILREHVTLISDTLTDFATGPPVPYYLFTPTVYHVDWEITRISLYMNVNKGNIINKPCSLSENIFLILRAPVFKSEWDIPRTEISSPVNVVNTVLNAPHINLDLSAPSWHTLEGFLDTQRMATVENFHVLMQYYFTTLSVSEHDGDPQFETNVSRSVDTQVVDVSGDNFSLTAHGFLIEYIMRIRENYFGHAYHFQTKEEFLDKMNQDSHTSSENNYDFKRSDVDTDTELSIRVSRGCVLLPKRLFSCRDCIALQFLELNADMRFTNYYMDLQVEIAPIIGRYLTGINPNTAFEEALSASLTNADLSISNLEVHAHRMFGLPPVEPTYVVRWDFAVGDITADMHPSFLRALGDAKMVFGHSFDDHENKPIFAPEELNDVTFVSLDVSSVDIIVRPTLNLPSGEIPGESTPIGNTRWQISTSAIKVRADDLANDHYSGKKTVEVPFIRVRAFAQLGEADTQVLEADTAVRVTSYLQKPFRKKQYRKQQDHIALHDSLTKRAEFLLNDETKERYPYTRQRQTDDLHPCIPLTPLATPMTRENVELNADLFFPMNNKRQQSWTSDSSKHTSLASLVDVGDDARDSFANSSEDEEDNDELDVPSMAKKARADYSGPTPDVYPFSSQSMSKDRNYIRDIKVEFGFKESPWHLKVPEFETVDDELEHDNLLIQIKPVSAQLTPNIMAVIDAFQFDDEKVDFELQLDMLQIMILRGLVREKTPTTSRRLYLTVPSLDFNFSEQIHSKYGGIRFLVEEMDVKAHILDMSIRGLQVEFDNLSLSLRQGFSLASKSRLNAASLTLSKIDFWWQQTSDEDSVGSLDMNGVDASMASDQIEWSINYVSRLIDALPTNVTKHSGPSNGTSVNKTSSISRQDELKATFYALTMAGEKMSVEQDSYVLSKPSGTIQSQDHVRTKMSWRIVMRLRYLLQRIPPTQRSEMEAAIWEGTFKLPGDAKEQMLNVYRNWRSWEQSKNLDETEIFKQVFHDRSFQEYMLSLTIKMSLRVESLVARIIYPDMYDHFAGLESLHITLASTQKNNVQNLGVAVQCTKARAKGSMELTTISASIMNALTNLDRRKQTPKHAEVESSKPLKLKEEMGIEATSARLKSVEDNSASSRALQANVSVFLLDLILEFDLEHLHIETQNHQIQFASAVELMETKNLASLFHIGTLVSSDGAFRVYRSNPQWSFDGATDGLKHTNGSGHRTDPRNLNNDDIFDSLVKGVQLGYASRGLGSQSTTWATLNIESVSFMSHLTANDLALLFVDFLQTELPAIQRAAAVLEDSTCPRRGSTFSGVHSMPPVIMDGEILTRMDTRHTNASATSTSKSSNSDDDENETQTAGQFMDVNIGSVKMKTRLVDELRFVWLAKELNFKIRNIGDIVSTFSVERSTVGIHFGDTYEAVANIQFELVRAVLKFDSHALQLSVFTNADAVRLGTMSLVWLLEYSKHRSIDQKISQVLDTLSRAMSLLNPESELSSSGLPQAARVGLPSTRATTAPTSPTSPAQTSKHPFSVRVANQIGEVSIHLPLDSSTFQLTVDGVYSHFENMKNAANEPRSISGGIKDLKLELVSTEQRAREMVRLQFDMSAHKSNGRILLNFASKHMKFGLDPESVGALFVATEKIKAHSRDFFTARTTEGAMKEDPANRDDNNGSSTFGVSDLENVRVKLLSQDVTLTWYTGLDSNQGIVIGYEKLQLKFAKLISRLELVGAYITPVKRFPAGGRETPMKERFNTAYVPMVEASALVNKSTTDENPWVRVVVTGDSVALTLVPSVAPWILALSDSVTTMSQNLQILAQKLALSSSSSSSSLTSLASLGTSEDESTSGITPSAPVKNFTLPFNVSINTNFASSALRLFDEAGRQKDPALELFSPSVQIMVEFENRKLLLRIDASKTSNKIYPKAISEVKAISTLIAAGLKQRSPKRSNGPLTSPSSAPRYGDGTSKHGSNPSPSREAVPTISSDFHEGKDLPSTTNLRTPVLGIEIDFRIHFDSQELYLSCLPFGKVGALLSTQGVDVVLMTPCLSAREFSSKKNQSESLSLLTIYSLVKHTQISLQHMYSSEVSALIEFSNFAALGMMYQDEPMKIVSNLYDPKLNIQLSKLHDMRIFFDIWALYENSAQSKGSPGPLPESTQLRRKYSTNSTLSKGTLDSPTSPTLGQQLFGGDDENVFLFENDQMQNEEAKLLDRYKNAVASVPTALIVNLNVINLRAILGMGPAIGDLDIGINRTWLAISQTTTMEQVANLGLDTLTAKFDGRLGGTFRLDGLLAKTAIQWKNNRSHPLMHAKIKFSKVGFYFSLDFHPFIAGDVNEFATVVTTQDRADVQDDRVHVAITCASVSIITTALVVVHSFDVIALFKRLQSQISNAPIFMMPEFSQESATRSAQRHEERYKRILAHQSQVNGTRVLIDVQLGHLLVHAFPTEFADNVALKVFAKRVDVHYDRSHYHDRYETSMDLALDESVVGLSNIRGNGYKKSLTDLDYEDLIQFVSKSSAGGTIFNTPEVSIVMDTWQYKNDPNVIFYKFSNEVRGSVDVGWNLGSVNFIKEMLNTHKDAWATRQDFYEASMQHIDENHRSAQAYREAAENLKRKASLKSNMKETDQSETVSDATSGVSSLVSSTLSPTSAEEQGDERENTPNMQLLGLKYIARETPVVLIPQLRDLGDATPPIEWLGVNRERIPLFIHAFLMRKLGVGADDIEKIYMEVVGRME